MFQSLDKNGLICCLGELYKIKSYSYYQSFKETTHTNKNDNIHKNESLINIKYKRKSLFNRNMICVSLSKDLAYRWNDMVLLYSETSNRPWYSYKLFIFIDKYGYSFRLFSTLPNLLEFYKWMRAKGGLSSLLVKLRGLDNLPSYPALFTPLHPLARVYATFKQPIVVSS